jgi:hypothetical protein
MTTSPTQLGQKTNMVSGCMRVFSDVTVGYNPGPQLGRNQLRVISYSLLVLWRNIREVAGRVNPKQDSKLIVSTAYVI